MRSIPAHTLQAHDSRGERELASCIAILRALHWRFIEALEAKRLDLIAADRFADAEIIAREIDRRAAVRDIAPPGWSSARP